MNASIRLVPSRLIPSLRPLSTVPLSQPSPSRTPANSQPIALGLRRPYATAPTPVKGAKPPITIHSLEGTYASALFSSSAANNAVLADIEKSLSAIRAKLHGDAKLASVVTNPALSHSEKLDVIKFLSQVGGGSQEATKAVGNLLQVMSENSRLGHLDGVVSAFERIMRAHKGEVDVTVTSAQVTSYLSPALLLAHTVPSIVHIHSSTVVPCCLVVFLRLCVRAPTLTVAPRHLDPPPPRTIHLKILPHPKRPKSQNGKQGLGEYSRRSDCGNWRQDHRFECPVSCVET